MVGRTCQKTAGEGNSVGEPIDARIDQHLTEALEHCEDDDAKYHLREALGLFHLE